jgi:hypothetical protein
MYSKTGYNSRTGLNGSKLRRYSCTTGQQPTLTFDHFIPPTGLDILVPNIIFTRTSNQWGYPRISNGRDLYCKGLHWYGGSNVQLASNMTVVDTIFGGQGFVELNGLNMTNSIFVGSGTNYSFKPVGCVDMSFDKVMFCEAPFFDNCSNTTMNNILFTSEYNSRNYFYMSSCINSTLTDISMLYLSLQIYNSSKDVTVDGISYHFDSTYNDFENMCNMYLCENIHVKNMSINDDFSCDSGKKLIKFSTNSYRCRVTNSYMDGSMSANYAYVLTAENRAKECGIYNVTYINKSVGYTVAKMTSSTTRCFMVDCNISDNMVQVGGDNPIVKNNIARYSWTPDIGAFGAVFTSNRHYANQNELYMTVRAGEPDETCITHNCLMDTKYNNAHLLEADSYVIMKINRDTVMRQIDSFYDDYLYGSYTNYIVITYSLDLGVTWKPLSELTSNEPVGDELADIWVKVARDGVATTSDVKFNALRLKATMDFAKPAYEPYFYWTEFNFLNMPTDDMNIRISVGNNTTQYLDAINGDYIHKQLWRESEEGIDITIRKYGYSDYTTKNVMNDTSINFFYTGHPIQDLTMTKSEALAITGVTLEYNENYYEHDLYWNYTLNCGGNNIEDVYHYLQAVISSTNTYFNKIGMDWWNMLIRDGDSFKTVNNGVDGVRVINYTGNISQTQSNSGEYYTAVQYANLKLSGLQSGSEVRIYDIDTGNEIGGKESTGTSFTYSYTWSGDINASVVVFHTQYNPIYFSQTLTSADADLPISQIYDRTYKNPQAPVLATNSFSLKFNTVLAITKTQLLMGLSYEGASYDISHVTGITFNSTGDNGTIVDNGDDTYTYTPNTDYIGKETGISFTPTYDRAYEGVITDGTVEFDMFVYYNQDRPDMMIVLGDSLFSEVFKTSDAFRMKFAELYGRDLTIVNKSLGGATTEHLRYQFDNIISNDAEIVDAYNNGDKIIAYYLIGGNNMKNSEENGTWREDLDQLYDDIANIKSQFDSKFPNIDFILADSQFKQAQKSTKEESVYWVADKEMVNEYSRVGAYAYWKDDEQPTTKCINKAQIDFNDSKYMLSNGCTLSQEYWATRTDPIKFFTSDAIHPNQEIGAYEFQQAILDGLFLYLEWGIYPTPVEDYKWYPTVYINISDATTIVDGYSSVGAGYSDRHINHINMLSTNSLVPVFDDNTTSPYTFNFSNTGANNIVDIPVQNDIKGFLWKEYRQKALQIDNGEILTITISGLSAGAIYKFQAIGSSGTVETVNTTGILKYPAMNKQSVRNCTVNHESESDPLDNHNQYWDMTIAPQGTSETLTLECQGTVTKTFISAIKFYKISKGDV